MAERIDRVGQRYGDYWLRRRLGGGGFGDVYLGEHMQEHSLAAVKVLQSRLTRSEEWRAFINEVRTFRLQHPHIVRLLDVGIAEDDTPFLVMDYAPGGTLRDRHPKGSRLPLATVLTYVTPIASALQYAHDRHLIHRDIKPENMLLGPGGQVWLSDFGIAAVAHSTHSLRTQEGVGGTLPYMAPEQIDGKPRPASDQYALGIVVYEWLCGERPFRGTALEIYGQQFHASPPSLRQRVPTLPPEVQSVVFTALAKDPKNRFGSVHAFATALLQAAQAPFGQAVPTEMSMESSRTIEHSWGGVTIEAEQQQASHVDLTGSQTTHNFLSSSPAELVSGSAPGSSPASSKSVTPLATPSPPLPQTASHPPVEPSAPSGLSVEADRRTLTAGRGLSRRQILSGLAVLALTVAGGGLILWRVSPPSPEGTLLYTYTGHASYVDAVAWSPDGTHVASGSADFTVQVWDAVDGGSVYTYRGHSNLVHAVAWSPDGMRIASGSFDHTVQVWDAMDGGNVYTYRGHSDVVNAVAWSPDGKRIASGSFDNTVQVWDAVDGSQVYTYRGHSFAVNAVAWSPDGKHIASGDGNLEGTSTVQVWDAADGSQVYTYRGHSFAVNAVVWPPDGRRIASGGDDQTVQVWDAADGGQVYTYRGHSDKVEAVAWSPDGRRIASGSADHTVQVWDAADGGQVYTYRGHSDVVYAVAWSPDGRRIASGSYSDHTVQVWKAIPS